jgi:Icc-related predicted phosphoesterase
MPIRAWILSDMHIDVGNDPCLAFRLPEVRPECDLVIIAGDIRENAVGAVRWIASSAFGKPVVFVPGNHEFYGRARDTEVEKAWNEARKHDGIHVLQDDVLRLTVRGEDLAVFGATLWTDYRIGGDAFQSLAMRTAQDGMNDHEHIRFAADGYRRWLPQDCLREHNETVRQLTRFLNDCDASGAARVVVTHHGPSQRSISAKFTGSSLNAAYVSNLDHLVERTSLWVHGHVHTSFDYKIGAGRVVCNPHGYGGENPNFDPALVVEIDTEPYRYVAPSVSREDQLRQVFAGTSEDEMINRVSTVDTTKAEGR